MSEAKDALKNKAQEYINTDNVKNILNDVHDKITDKISQVKEKAS
jgi:hypothetical protein